MTTLTPVESPDRDAMLARLPNSITLAPTGATAHHDGEADVEYPTIWALADAYVATAADLLGRDLDVALVDLQRDLATLADRDLATIVDAAIRGCPASREACAEILLETRAG